MLLVLLVVLVLLLVLLVVPRPPKTNSKKNVFFKNVILRSKITFFIKNSSKSKVSEVLTVLESFLAKFGFGYA